MGYQIHNYRIEEFLGEGAFGITYKAIDLNLNRPVAIKEFIPAQFAIRADNDDVEPKNADCEEIYQKGLMSYVKEAQVLARFKHENIVQIYTFLRRHKTAYIIMEYVDGMTFSQWLRQNPNPTEQSLIEIMSPILAGLHELHKLNLLHRDIKPNNIYICQNQRPVLLDFGTVRDFIPADPTGDMSAIVLTEGYAPPEQYGKSGQGPWTDVYAVGACLHLAVTGQMIKNAMERTTQVANGMPDPQPRLQRSALRNDYTEEFLATIEQAISLRPKDRIEDAQSLNNRLPNVAISSSNLQGTDGGDVENQQTVVRAITNNNSQEEHSDRKQLLEDGMRLVDTLPEKQTSYGGSDALDNKPTIVNDLRVRATPAAETQVTGDDRTGGTDAHRNVAPSQSVDPAPRADVPASRTDVAASSNFKKLVGGGIGLVALAGIGVTIWPNTFWPNGDQIPEGALNDTKSQIEQKILSIQAMELPRTSEYENAMTKRQLALDIETNKLPGSLRDINDNLLSADAGLEAYILSAAPSQNAALLEKLKAMENKVQRLGVQNAAEIELVEYEKMATDIESLRSHYDGLSGLVDKLETAIMKNDRAYMVGSSEKDIAEALDICKQYANDCQREWYEDELQREVVLSPFDLDKSEITVGQFRRYAEAHNTVTTAESTGFSYTVDSSKSFAVESTDGVYWQTAYAVGVDVNNLPVVHISRMDASSYCESMERRIPTEAEWEYVAKGPARHKFPWGNTWDGAKIHWGGNGYDGMMPVNSFPANATGHFDLGGSVTEWTSSDSVEENTGILKGGSRFDSNVANFRLSVRRLENTNYTGEDVGFRCAGSTDVWPSELSE